MWSNHKVKLSKDYHHYGYEFHKENFWGCFVIIFEITHQVFFFCLPLMSLSSSPWTSNYCISSDMKSHSTSHQRLFWSHSDGRETHLFVCSSLCSFLIVLSVCVFACACPCTSYNQRCLIVLACVQNVPLCMTLWAEWGRREKNTARRLRLLSLMQTGQWTPHGWGVGGHNMCIRHHL